MDDETDGDRLRRDTTVNVLNINSVLIGEGVKVEFEFVIRAPGFESVWGAAERVLPWPMHDVPGD